MLKTRSYEFGGKTITLHELDVVTMIDLVGKAREIADPTDLDLGNAYEYMPEFVMDKILKQPLRGLIVEGVSHDDLEGLYRAALELNPFLARAMKSMADAIKASQLMLQQSNGLLSDLLNEVTTGSGNTGSVPS